MRAANSRRRPRPTLREGLDLRDNGLNLLRLLFAALVIATHAPRVAGIGDEISVGHVSLSGLAVGGFFAVSGFLIARSRLQVSGAAFALRRLGRVLPGYWLCLVVTAFLFSAEMGTSRGGWSPGAAIRYVAAGVPMVTWRESVGRTLAGAPFADNINGSLWTLPVELGCYLVLGLVLALPFARHRLRLTTTTALAGATAVSFLSALRGGDASGFFGLAAAFAAGAALYAWQDRVVLDGRLALLCAALFVAAVQTPQTTVLGSLPYAYLCLWLGVVCPARLRRIGSRNDISYGVYLYGFPVQQTLVAFGVHRLGVLPFFVASLGCAALFGWVSWLLVERPVNEVVKLWTTPGARVAVPKHRAHRAPVGPTQASWVSRSATRAESSSASLSLVGSTNR